MSLKKIKLFSNYIEISIPTELAKFAVWQRNVVTRYETNQLIKAIDTWLILKHLTTSGQVKEWNRQKEYLLKCCKCTDATLRTRLRMLHELKLITWYKIERKNDSIKVCSWSDLETVFSIDTEKRLSIQYNINDAQTIQQWLIAAEIEDNKDRQDFAITCKVSANPEVKSSFDAAIIEAGADRSKLDDMQYFLSWLRMIYTNDFIRASMAHDELVLIRPDNNRSVRGIASAWNKPRGNITEEQEEKHLRRLMVRVSYWKKRMKQSRVIDYTSLQVCSQERVRNNHCKVLWLKKEKQTLLCLCDQIQILKPWLITDEFRLQPAA